VPDLSLDVLVRLLSDRKGGDEALESLRQTRAAAGDLGEETKRLGRTEEEASKLTELLHHNHRALHMVMHEIGNSIAPGMGRAMAAALMGPIGIALAAASAFMMLKEHIKKTNEELDKMGASAAEAFAGYKTNLVDAIRNERFSTEKIDEYFTHIKEGAAAAKTAIEDAMKLLEAKLTAEESANKAAEALELASLKVKVDSGNISKAAAAEEEAAIKAKYAQKEMVIKQEEADLPALTAQKEVARIQGELTKAQADAAKVRPISEINAQTTDTSQTIANLKKRIGINAETNVHEKGGLAEEVDEKKAELQAALDTNLSIQAFDKEALETERETSNREADIYELEHEKAAEKILKDSIAAEDAKMEKAQHYLQQQEDKLAKLKQEQKTYEDLKKSIEEFKTQLADVTADLKSKTDIGGVKKTSIIENAATEAATAAVEQAAAIASSAGGVGGAISAGATAGYDLQNLRQQGYTPERIAAEYQGALIDNERGGNTAADNAAIQRYQRMLADQTAIKNMNMLIQTFGSQQQQLIDVMNLFQTGQITLQQEIDRLRLTAQRIG